MQISMNQGTGLSERNWLTEGCHLCAWKMMDPICKLLLYPTAPPLLLSPHPHTDTRAHPPPPSPPSPLLVIKQGSEPMTLLANNKWSGRIGTLLVISSDCQAAHRGPVRFQWWQDRLTSWTLFFIFLSFSILLSKDINKMKPISMNPQTHEWSFQNIRLCVLDRTVHCFFPLTPCSCLIWEAKATPKDEQTAAVFCTLKLNRFIFHI